MSDTQPQHIKVLTTGAEYLDQIVADLEKQESSMLAEAKQTEYDQVRDGYLKFAAVLHHCADTLRSKSTELRAGLEA